MSDSVVISQGPCEDCGSSDACTLYSDGHTFCFSCEEHRSGEGATAPTTKRRADLIDFEVGPLPVRKITEETCAKWRYGKGTAYNPSTGREEPCQVANYYSSGRQLVGQQLRFADKTFRSIGETSGLYGEWLWRDGGRKVVITEGQIDALSVSQLQGNKWPVVSIPNGAKSAKKAVTKSLEWLERFDEVVLMFDMDERGMEAVEACAAILSPGKAKVAQLPHKDANECLVKGEGDKVIDALWGARTYRPDGIVDAEGALEILRSRNTLKPVAAYPHAGIQNMTRGLYPGQVVTVTSGSGMGKSELVREWAYDFRQQGLKVGYVALEESVDRSLVGMCGIHMSKRLHLVDEPLKEPGFEEAYNEVCKDHFYFYDHFGSMEDDSLLSKLRYLRVACGVDVIVLDHISIVVSGLEGDDERKVIDRLMTKLRSLAEETGVAIVCVSHLKRPMGTPHEEGGRTSLAQLRGSGAIGQLSDIAFGIERNQQAEGDEVHTSVIRLLKNRKTGETGIAGFVYYDTETGRFTECGAPGEDGSSDCPF